MGMNGLDVAGLRPFDLVIPFTIQKGEITGEKRCRRWTRASSDLCSLLKVKSGCPQETWPNPTSRTTRTGPSPSSTLPPKPGSTRWTSNMTASTSQVPPAPPAPQTVLTPPTPERLSPVLTGSPLQFFVDYMNSGNVSAYGPGLIHGTVNKPAVFTVDTKDAGEGERLHPPTLTTTVTMVT